MLVWNQAIPWEEKLTGRPEFTVSSDCNPAQETCSFKRNLGNYGSDYYVSSLC